MREITNPQSVVGGSDAGGGASTATELETPQRLPDEAPAPAVSARALDRGGPVTIVRVLIDRVSIDGIRLEPGQQRLFRGCLEAELGRLLGRDTLPVRLEGGGMLGTVTPGGRRIAEWASPADLARQVAQAVYRSLQR